jgi:hypothetical protein
MTPELLEKVDMNSVIKQYEIPINEFIDAINERGTVHAKLIASYVVDGYHHIEVEYTILEKAKMIKMDYDPETFKFADTK